MLARLIAFLSLLLLPSVTASEAAERRVALVIAVEAYTAIAPLTNPVNDGTAVAAALRTAGFEVTELVNPAELADLGAAVTDFREKAAQADAAVIYSAGHGVAADGANWLLPANIRVERKEDLRYRALLADDLVEAVEGARKVRLVILDACRNNPFLGKRGFEAGSAGAASGLVRHASHENAVILFATAPNQTASDGKGRPNSPFAAALAYAIQTPGMRLAALPSEVSHLVRRATFDTQMPDQQGIADDPNWTFLPAATTQIASREIPAGLQAPAPGQDPAFEAMVWQAAMATGTEHAFKAYLNQYPNGHFAAFAQDRLAQLSTGTNTATGRTLAVTDSAAPTKREADASLSPSALY